MRSIGDGPSLWRVRVAVTGKRVEPDLAESVMRYLESTLTGEQEPFDIGADFADGETGSPIVGASFWVRAADVGAAALLAVVSMMTSYQAVTSERPSLYEVELVPREAVLLHDEGERFSFTATRDLAED